MIRAYSVLAGLLIVVASIHRTDPAVAETDDCTVPAELVEAAPKLPQLAGRLRAKLPVTVVAIGGASTAGTAAGGEEQNAYPRRLEEALKRRHPGISITVINKGIPRETAGNMLDRFPRDVYPAKPILAIWETGTVEAVRGYDVEEFAAALHSGITDLHEHKVEVILVDMQYNQGTASVINYEPYLDAMRRTADVEDVYLFRRYEMMKYWGENGIFSFVDVPQTQRAGLAAAVYKCLGERLADAIDRATE